MSLKIRRGLEADRLGITPDEGEFIYTTDDKLLYIGDGSTSGGNLVAGSAAVLDYFLIKDNGSPQGLWKVTMDTTGMLSMPGEYIGLA
ncbi:MAG: hypothetical protein V4549_17930 [Bacteroidota bacterium]